MTVLDLIIAPAYAQAASPAPPSMLSTLMFPIVLIALMYLMMIRPQLKRSKEHKAMVEALSVGDEVITNGGIAGIVRAIGDSFLTVEVADEVQLRVQRNAVATVLPKGTLKAA